MKKKACVILGAGALAGTRQTRGGKPQARRIMTENGFMFSAPFVSPVDEKTVLVGIPTAIQGLTGGATW